MEISDNVDNNIFEHCEIALSGDSSVLFGTVKIGLTGLGGIPVEGFCMVSLGV